MSADASPNLLARGTALDALGRVPPWADDLWARVHRVDGRCILASRLVLDGFQEAFDRLGLAEIGRAEIERLAIAAEPADKARLRYHAVAFFEHLGGVARVLRALAAGFDGEVAAALERHRNALLRIEKLAAEAAHPAGLRFEPPDVAARLPPDRAEAELSERGVAAKDPQPREWLPIPELALAMSADAALALEAAARAAIRRLDAGAPLALDARIEK